MRVYEFSKKANLSNKIVLEALHAAGFDVQSHMTVLSPDMLVALEQKYSTTQALGPSLAPTPTESNVKNTQKNLLRESAPREKMLSPQKDVATPAKPLEVVVRQMVLSELADQINHSSGEIILYLLKRGIVVAKNQVIPEKLVLEILQNYQVVPIEFRKASGQAGSIGIEPVVRGSGSSIRAPIVVVIGHVDHGKTSLLDFIRKSRVAAREKGGITQHLGAYEAETAHGKIVFLDTPGHEAFSTMRIRGARVADIAILVVAVDDGIMPQTVEAIKVAQQVGLPLIVALNKVDKVPPARIDAVKQMLSQYALVPEEWGGQIIMVPISAKFGTGIDQLLEMINIQAQLMELSATREGYAKGFVLEAKMEKGLGAVATVVTQQGTLRVGDHFVCGSVRGKVTALIDSHGRRVQAALPAVPVLVAGFSELVQAGELFEVASVDAVKKSRFDEGLRASDERQIRQQGRQSSQNSLNIIVKTDGASSREALLGALSGFSGKTYKAISVISSGIGSITESDVRLASDTNSLIYTLHVRSEPNAQLLAQKLGVIIKVFEVIYKLLEDVQGTAELGRPVKTTLKKIGEAIVIKVFPIKNVGVIAGSQIKSGRFVRHGKVVVWRGKQKIGEGLIESLQREKKSVKEIQAGFECGILVRGLADWQLDDRVECFIEEEVL